MTNGLATKNSIYSINLKAIASASFRKTPAFSAQMCKKNAPFAVKPVYSY
jgi:hypothetical protein